MSDRGQPEMTVIGRDTRIKGEMYFENGARILGRFEGKIAAQGEVQIGESATCDASVEADTVVVDGRVTGDLTARSRLSLNSNAQVQGDLTAGTLVVAEGATFVGHCTVGPEAAKLIQQRDAAPAASTPARNGAESRGAARAAADAEIDFKPPWRQNGNGSANGVRRPEPAVAAAAAATTEATEE